MKKYKITIRREGKWWMVTIPEINGLTQARKLSEVELMAKEYIAVATDVEVEDVKLDLITIAVGDLDVVSELGRISSKREEAARLEREATSNAARIAKILAADHVPVRDIGEAMHISYQRAAQLVNM